MRNLSVTLLGACLLLPSAAHGLSPQASRLLHLALKAQGGEQALRSIQTVQWQAVGYRNALEQSVRPKGPYIVEFDDRSVLHDFTGHRYLDKVEAKTYPVDSWVSGTVVNNGVAMSLVGGRKTAGTALQVEIAREREALSPERLLLTALDAPDTHLTPDTVLQSIPQNVVAFSLDGASVRIYLNEYTHLPTAVDYSGPAVRSGYWAFLGDVTERTYYEFWWLAKDGIHFPLQWNIEVDGLPSRMFTISKLEVDAPVDAAQVAIPEEIRARFKPDAPAFTYDQIPLGLREQPAKELEPGIVFIPGRWNVTLVRQSDGIVILEAPISSGYSAEVIAEAHRRFPGAPIKAVVTTSNAWPHIAGIREYAANSIPIYSLDLNRPVLQWVIDMPYTSRPDKEQTDPRKPQFHLITERTMLGAGKNRMEIYPIRGETSERQMMVYFPEYHLLYGSDVFQQLPDGSFFYPQAVSELTDAVKRDHLDVRQFFMMHVGPTPWPELAKAITATKQTDSPTGKLM